MRLIADITAYPDYVLVRCQGRFICEDDMESIAEKVLELQRTPAVVLVDASEVKSIRDTDLGLLWLRFMEANARGWRLALVRMPDHLRSALNNCGLEQAIPAFESEPVACAALGANTSFAGRAAS